MLLVVAERATVLSVLLMLRPFEVALFFNTVQFKDADTRRVPSNGQSKMPAQFVLSYGHSKLMPRVPSTRSALWFLHSVCTYTIAIVVQRYGGIKDRTVRHRTMINDCRFLPSLCVWEASTSIDDAVDVFVVCRYGVTCYEVRHTHTLTVHVNHHRQHVFEII